jgi:MFS superfamily sulfate permease-like transporter
MSDDRIVVSRPRVEVLGEVEGFPGFHSVARHEGAKGLPGVLLFRFNAPITFFNAPHFKRELLRAVEDAEPGLRNVVIDLLPVTSIDATGLMTITELVDVLGSRGIGLNTAGRATEWGNWAAERGFNGRLVGKFPTLRQAVRKLSTRPSRIDEQPAAQDDG